MQMKSQILFEPKSFKNLFLSFLGFFVAFFGWFAFPPLLPLTLKTDLNLTKADIANSNILGFTSTLIVRVFSGYLCEKYGPRKTMAWLLLAGSIPTVFTGLVNNSAGLIAIRFFVGILGGTFVPCQAWITAFYDSNIVGTANAIAAGVVFYVMPALVSSIHISHSWRIAFLFPFGLIVSTAIIILVFGDDGPAGEWKPKIIVLTSTLESNVELLDRQSELDSNHSDSDDKQSLPDNLIEYFRFAIKPTTLLVAIPYLCTFGSELAIEGMISVLYLSQSQKTGLYLTEQQAGNYAAVFGLMNIVTRPLGGYICDFLSVQNKKLFIILLGLLEGLLCIIIGSFHSLEFTTLFIIMTITGIILEQANGATFSLVSHFERNGIVSGIVGAAGNLGGIIFSLFFRYDSNFMSILSMGIIIFVLHLLLIIIPLTNK
ncbi:hypothetical protein HK103_004930 [Boothiomyces macroporosus]|uniref:Major facilitator superfamily (MFS) profile domain-containing protein n=1 Tax=Boothiomyces macroporosus TaxID=261099 RepID=A0AAD5UG33_9FUNG|nr:hypothetical protein HK103_004930 [Boothiomyces macroporosus]